MNKNIIPFNWKPEIDSMTEINRIGDDIMLIENPIITSVFEYPFRIDVVTAVICLRGTMDGFVNLKEHHVKAPGFSVILPGQILGYKQISDDFKGLFIVLSRRFVESLNIEERYSFFQSIQNTPYIPLDGEGVEAFISYYRMMQRMMKQTGNPNRLEIARLLTKAFFYGAGHYLHDIPDDHTKTSQELLVNKFIRLVEANYKEHRSMEFYADKMCLSSKHISSIVREVTGKTATDWIDEHVVLEARALLKSTNMTIQQISDELNFPSQSFFGKYFKRIVGVPPKEYRSSK